MRIAISNIAWDIAEDDSIANLLSKYNIDAIDIAPGKYFPNPAETTDNEIQSVKDYWGAKGIEITGMQSLLFGTQGLNIFGSNEVRGEMLKHLGAVIRIAENLGAYRLVFGSPKNRDRGSLSDERVTELATSFFTALGDIAKENGVLICLEPNPECYGANFMMNGMETFEVVKVIDHPAIKMQLDTGAMTINQEHVKDLLVLAKSSIGHIHISEPMLAVIGDGDNFAHHQGYAKAIREHFSDPLISIEMVATSKESHLSSIERAVSFVRENYGLV